MSQGVFPVESIDFRHRTDSTEKGVCWHIYFISGAIPTPFKVTFKARTPLTFGKTASTNSPRSTPNRINIRHIPHLLKTGYLEDGLVRCGFLPFNSHLLIPLPNVTPILDS